MVLSLPRLLFKFGTFLVLLLFFSGRCCGHRLWLTVEQIVEFLSEFRKPVVVLFYLNLCNQLADTLLDEK